MLVKTEAQESLEFGLKIHSFADVLTGFWKKVDKAVKRQGEHSIFRDDLKRVLKRVSVLFLYRLQYHLGELKVSLKILVGRRDPCSPELQHLCT